VNGGGVDGRRSTLTVAVDAGPLLGARTGIGQFTAHLIDALRALDAPPAIVPYVLSGRAPLQPGVRRLPYPARLALLAWGRFDRPNARHALRGVDVVHGTNYVVPPTGWPTVVTVHDCSPVTRPDLVHPVVRAFVPVLRRAIARGAWVHTPSQFVADQVVDLLGAPAGRVRAIPHGAPPPLPTREVLDATAWPAGLEVLAGRRYVVALGTREPRKNLATLVNAFAHVGAAHPDVLLALVGPPGADDDAIATAVRTLPPAVRDRVIVHGYVDDDGRARLLADATALVYPSLDEGFGLPLLEAMAAGVPAVVGRVGAVPEVAGDAALLVDPVDVDALAAAIVRLLVDEPLRNDLVARGHTRAARYTWAGTAAAMVDLYRDAMTDIARPSGPLRR
jgi:glycosyltransferase involved in cell wall biosynthesis